MEKGKNKKLVFLSHKTAFTLIELLVVIAIIGILSGLIIVTMSGVTNSANIAKGQIFSNSLRNALMMNIIGEWKFDELTAATNGATIKDSWGSNNGTLSTGDALDKLKTGSECVSGKCLSFDGTDDYVSVPDNANWYFGTENFTIGHWVRFNSVAVSSGFYGQYINGTNFWGSNWQQSSKVLSFYAIYNPGSYVDTWAYCSWTPVTNAWYYIAFVRDGAAAKIFINGVSQSVILDGWITMPDYASALRIGCYQDVPWYMNGLIDDVRIYNAAIPTSQIQEQYYLGLNKLFTKGEITKEEYSQRLNSFALK